MFSNTKFKLVLCISPPEPFVWPIGNPVAIGFLLTHERLIRSLKVEDAKNVTLALTTYILMRLQF